VVIIAALFIPVNLTVLAPAQLIPFQPASVRAPMNGVIEKVLVEPNQQVERHTPLFEYDRSEIKNRMQVAEGAIAILEAEYRQKSQLAVFDQSSKGMLAMIQGEISEKAVELEYLKDIDKRSLVLAPEAGMVLFDDPSEWVGRPVVTGEKMMLVAVQDAVEIEAWLSPADVIPLDAGAPVSLYLNSDPLHSFSAQLRYVGFEALQRPDGHYAYRVRARLDGVEALPQVGLKGTAKIEGEEVTLAYWIFRRPLASLRAWLGW
jgi:hypothetical protein